MTKEEVLQKANDYCTEKAYTETLTEEFKDKFSDFFAKKYPETDAEDETMIADLKFNLDTAFSATSKGITSKQKAFEDKENEYKNQIAELNKKLGKQTKTPPTAEIPKEVQDQLDELKRFKTEEQKKTKYANVINIAKKGIRSDLHSSFEKFAKTVSVSVDKDDEEQAKEIVQTFQDIFKDSIGDIKPYTPKQVQQKEEEIINNVTKITL